MRGLGILSVVMTAALLAACSSPAEDAARAQERAFEAQEDLAKERIALVDQYRDCVTTAAGDSVKVEACDTFLKAAEALR